MRRFKAFSVTILSTFLMVSCIQPIPGLFNTGVDDSGSVLNVGDPDTHYALSGPLTSALVVTLNSTWVPAPEGSAWIGPRNGNTSAPLGTYVYTLIVDLTGLDPASATVSGALASDNTPSIMLNGVDTGFTHPDQMFSLGPFSITDGFVAGENLLQFSVTNNPGTGTNPTGLLVSNLQGQALPSP